MADADGRPQPDERVTGDAPRGQPAGGAGAAADHRRWSRTLIGRLLSLDRALDRADTEGREDGEHQVEAAWRGQRRRKAPW